MVSLEIENLEVKKPAPELMYPVCVNEYTWARKLDSVYSTLEKFETTALF